MDVRLKFLPTHCYVASVARTPPPTFSPGYAAFLASMTMTLEKWREGIGFDLVALGQTTDSERNLLVKTLSERLETEGDWREIEALGAIGTPEAKEVIRRASRNGTPETRLYAEEQLLKLDEPANLESAIIDMATASTAIGDPTTARALVVNLEPLDPLDAARLQH